MTAIVDGQLAAGGTGRRPPGLDDRGEGDAVARVPPGARERERISDHATEGLPDRVPRSARDLPHELDLGVRRKRDVLGLVVDHPVDGDGVLELAIERRIACVERLDQPVDATRLDLDVISPS